MTGVQYLSIVCLLLCILFVEWVEAASFVAFVVYVVGGVSQSMGDMCWCIRVMDTTGL